MKKIILLVFSASMAMLIFQPEVVTGRGRGGGGGGGGRGGGGGGGGGGRAASGGGAVGSYGGGASRPSASPGGGAGSRPSTPIAGPGGGSGTAGKGGGAVTKGGAGGTAGSGVSGGKAVGGGQVAGPGGRDATKVGSAGGATGPGGKSGATVGSGSQGGIGNKYQGGVAIGPQGGAAAGAKAGAAAGAGGAAAAGTRAAAAGGAYGAAAGRSTAVAGRGTYYRSAATIRGQGAYVRQGVANYPCFRAGWYTQHPGAWLATGWAAGAVWRSATWGACSSYCGVSDEPVYYDYGESVVYQDDGVYFNGEKAYSTEEYVQQATALADAGRDAKVPKDEDFLSLGVFAMVQGEEKASNYIFQLAINKKGIIRGNYYDAVTDSTTQVYGSVDKASQRAAWTVGDRKTPIYEAGIANLTKSETTMVVHYDKERTQQFSLVRIEEGDVKEGDLKDGK